MLSVRCRMLDVRIVSPSLQPSRHAKQLIPSLRHLPRGRRVDASVTQAGVEAVAFRFGEHGQAERQVGVATFLRRAENVWAAAGRGGTSGDVLFGEQRGDGGALLKQA